MKIALPVILGFLRLDRRLTLFFSVLTLGTVLSAGAATPSPEPVRIDGKTAHPTRLLAAFKDEEIARKDSHAASTEAARSLPKGERIARRYRSLPEVVVLEPTEAALSSRSRADDLALRLEKRRKELLATGLFEYVEPDWVVSIETTPNDSAFTDGTLWGLRNTGQEGGVAGVDVDAVEAWEITTGSPDVVVGVIDSGIRLTHEDLEANLWTNPDEIPGNGLDDDGNGFVDDIHGINAITGSGDPTDDEGHGTHVAGTIGAVGNGGGRHVGVAWNTKLMGLKFLSSDGTGFTSDAVTCLDYAVAEGARITNNSWGGGGFSSAMRQAIQRANEAGVLFVAAAGNDSADNDRSDTYPANYDVPNVVSVASITRRGDFSGFSNFGATTVDLGAPGSDIFSTTNNSDSSYGSLSGTSMASPHVAGVAALLAAEYPAENPQRWKQRLLRSTDPLDELRGATVSGGRVSASGALLAGPDGALEAVASGDPFPLLAGENAAVFVSVSDFDPIPGATVSAAFGDEQPVAFRDNGQAPDETAGDGIYSAILAVPTGVSSVTLNAAVEATGFDPINPSLELPVAAAPENDDFADALPTTGTRSNGSNVNSSFESGEPRRPTVAGGKSVWWQWEAPEAGAVTITTSGSDFDTTLAIYTGSLLGNLRLIAENDDDERFGLQSAVEFNARAGETYWIQVNGFQGSTGEITLNHPDSAGDSGAPRIIGEPRSASVLARRPFEVSVTAVGDDLSYQWHFNGEPIDGATDSTFSVESATENDEGEYFVTVSNPEDEVQSRTIFISVNQVGLLPENDRFADAARLNGSQGRLAGQNRDASGEPGEPNHGSIAEPLNSLWFAWEADVGGELRINTDGSNFDTVLAVYRGTSLDSLQPVAFNDNSGGETSALSVTTSPGAAYRIALDGNADSVGDFVLNHRFLPDPEASVVSDSFAGRIPLSGSLALGSNTDATGEPGEPDHAGVSKPLSSVWWTWTAPADGTATFDTFGSNFDTTLALYRGTTVAGLVQAAANDDELGFQSRVQLPVTRGDVFQVAVDGFAFATGSIQLNVETVGNDGLFYEHDGNFGSLRILGQNQFLSPDFGTISFASGGFDRGWAWSLSLRTWLQGLGGRVTSSEYGSLQTGSKEGWVFSEYFGWTFYGTGPELDNGWVWTERFGWMRFETDDDETRLYVDGLRGFLEVRENGEFHSLDYRLLRPDSLSDYTSPVFGKVVVGDFAGWIFSERFGWLWAARDSSATWYWSDDRQEWLGVTEDGGVWSTTEGRFL